MRTIFEQFNFKKAARELGVSVWQTPNFLFVTMGLAIVVIITLVYFFTRSYDDLRVLVLSECLVVVMLFSVGSSVISRITDIAKMNRLKTRFIELASNRLKDPLAAIRWELEILLGRTEGNLNSKQKKAINSIIESNESMINLVKDLLDIVRVEDRQTIEGKDIINLNRLIGQVIYGQKEYSKSRNIEINCENHVPREYCVKGDKKLLQIAIENIVSNAIRFSPRSKVIDVILKEKKEKVLIEVRDRGYGIPESEKEFIFKRFYRASNALNHDIEGTGLGLYVSKRIVDGSGGKIFFNSEENKGSEFKILLPVYKDES